MSHDHEIRYLGDLQRLTIGKDDVLVLTTDKRLTGEQHAQITDSFDKVNLGCCLLILDGGMKAGVLTKEQLA